MAGRAAGERVLCLRVQRVRGREGHDRLVFERCEMTVIEQAEARLQEEIRQNDMGADNGHLMAYWAAYLDGARAQLNELSTFPSRREAEA